jgi:transposase
MFLKKSTTTIRGKTYNNYKIVESYREGGNVKHRILFPLGALTEEQAEQLRLVVSAHSNPDVVVAKSDQIVVTKHAGFLAVATLHHFWEEWGFADFFRMDRWVEAMVLNRCLEPVTKIKIKEWMAETVLPAYLEVDPHKVDEFDVYRSLDDLAKREKELQVFLYQQLQAKQSFSGYFFYDLTSTYLEGSRCLIAKLGYSRDHRPDCEQIVIALMVTPEGYPFHWQVLEGNTQDVTTIEQLIWEVNSQYHLQHCTLVFDRGMVSANNLISLEAASWNYVSALDRDEIVNVGFLEGALPEPASLYDWEQVMTMREFVPFDEDQLLFYREFTKEERRYVLTFDVARFLEEYRSLKRRLNQAITWLEQKNKALAQAKKARNQEILTRELETMLKRKRVKRLLKVCLEPREGKVTNARGKERIVHTFQFAYAVNEEERQKEQRLHGLTCFVTNLPAQKASAQEVISWYRRKNKVEEAFREIKSYLELRPIYLTRTERVRAHVSICILAYFLYNEMERHFREKGLAESPPEVLARLQKCQVNRLEFKTQHRSKLSITEPSEQQKEYLQVLGCENILAPQEVKQVLKKIENWL